MEEEDMLRRPQLRWEKGRKKMKKMDIEDEARSEKA
jgi:hypothetical protein